MRNARCVIGVIYKPNNIKEMKTKHTKGLWSQRRTFNEPLFVRDEANDREWYSSTIDIHAENNRIIGHVEYQTDCENQGWGKVNKISEWEANAKLIAAAPEMLEALLEMREWYEANQHNVLGELTPICFSKGLSAILKATE